MSSSIKYWFGGLAVEAIPQLIPTGKPKYWINGLVVRPILYPQTPTPPAGSTALPSAMALARGRGEEEWRPMARRRFAPVIAPVTAPRRVVLFTVT